MTECASGPWPIPELHGSRVRLRPHRDADVDAVLERCLDPDTVRWTTVPSPYTREMAAEYVAGLGPSTTQVSWAIEVDGRYAGTIDLRAFGCDAEHAAGNFGFVTHPALRGRGVMSEAVSLAVDHAFDTLGWQHLTWQGNVGNVASYKAVWRAGFPVPTFVPALLPHRGRMVDAWHSLLERGAPRAPSVPWAEVQPLLEEQVRTARRPG